MPEEAPEAESPAVRMRAVRPRGVQLPAVPKPWPGSICGPRSSASLPSGHNRAALLLLPRWPLRSASPPLQLSRRTTSAMGVYDAWAWLWLKASPAGMASTTFWPPKNGNYNPAKNIPDLTGKARAYPLRLMIATGSGPMLIAHSRSACVRPVSHPAFGISPSLPLALRPLSACHRSSW